VGALFTKTKSGGEFCKAKRRLAARLLELDGTTIFHVYVFFVVSVGPNDFRR
jgi:hypothetical protein